MAFINKFFFFTIILCGVIPVAQANTNIFYYVAFKAPFCAGSWGSKKIETIFNLSLAKRDALGFIAAPAVSVSAYSVIRFLQDCYYPSYPVIKKRVVKKKEKEIDESKQQEKTKLDTVEPVKSGVVDNFDHNSKKRKQLSFRKKIAILLSGVAGIEFLSGWLNPGARSLNKCIISLPSDIKRVFTDFGSLTKHSANTAAKTLQGVADAKYKEAITRAQNRITDEDADRAIARLEKLQLACLTSSMTTQEAKLEVYGDAFPEIHLHDAVLKGNPLRSWMNSTTSTIFKSIIENQLLGQYAARRHKKGQEFGLDVYSLITKFMGTHPDQLKQALLLAAPKSGRYGTT